MSKTHVPLNRTIDNPHQVRIDTGDLDSLAQSILQHGLRQLPEGRLIGPSGEPVEGSFSQFTEARDGEWFVDDSVPTTVELASGHRRAAAVQLLNDDDTVSKAQLANIGLACGHVPVDLQRLSDEEMLDLGTVENVDREGLSPIEEARQIKEHVEFGRSGQEIAEMFGKSPSWVSNRKRLTDLPVWVQEHVHEGDISVRQAQALVRHEEVEDEAKEVLGDFQRINSDLHAGNLVTGAKDGGLTSEDIRERTATLELLIQDAKKAKEAESRESPEFPCAFCMAEAGEPCTTRDGKEVAPHRAREKALAAKEAGVLEYERVSADHLRALIEPPSTKVKYSGQMFKLGDLVAAHQILRGYDSPTARDGHKARARKLRVEMERRVEIDGETSLNAEEVVKTAPKWLRERLDGVRTMELSEAIRQAAGIHTDPAAQTDDDRRDGEQSTSHSSPDAGARTQEDIRAGGGGQDAPDADREGDEGAHAEECDEEEGPASRIVLVACSQSKMTMVQQAQSLYTGQLFQKSKAYAQQLLEQGKADAWFILSAKHGLLEPTETVEPYDATLADETDEFKKKWAQEIIDDLLFLEGDELTTPVDLVVLGGKDYWQPLKRLREETEKETIGENVIRVRTPFRDAVGNGEMMQWLDVELEMLEEGADTAHGLPERDRIDPDSEEITPADDTEEEQFVRENGEPQKADEMQADRKVKERDRGESSGDGVSQKERSDTGSRPGANPREVQGYLAACQTLLSLHDNPALVKDLLQGSGYSKYALIKEQEKQLGDHHREMMGLIDEALDYSDDDTGTEGPNVGHVDQAEVSALLSCSDPESMWDAAAEASIASLYVAFCVSEKRMEQWRSKVILEEIRDRGEQTVTEEDFPEDVWKEAQAEIERRLEPEVA